MKSRTSLKEALRAMAEENRDRPSPSFDQLIAYHEGRLPESERDEVQDYICYTPEAAQFLLHLSHCRDMEPLSDERVASDKQAFFQRLDRLEQEESPDFLAGDEPPSGSPARSGSDASRRGGQESSSGWPTQVQTAYAMAAAFFFLAVALFISSAMEAPVEAQEVDAGSMLNLRGSSGLKPLAPIEAGRRFTFRMPVPEEDVGRLFELRVTLDGDDLEISGADLTFAQQSEQGQAFLRFESDALPAGDYLLSVYVYRPLARAPDSTELSLVPFPTRWTFSLPVTD